MRFLNLLFILVCLLCMGCVKHYCDDKDTHCVDHYLGFLQLVDSTQNWVPYSDVSNSLTFKNSDGDLIQFNNSGFVYDSINFNVYQSGEKCTNKGESTESCYSYYNTKRQNYTFVTSDPSSSYVLSRTKDVEFKDPFVGEYNDILELRMNKDIDFIYYRIKMDKASHSSNRFNTIFDASLTLDGTTFNNVYTGFYKDTSYTNEGFVSKIYYNRTQGLIGFCRQKYDATNKVFVTDLWVLQ